METPPPSSPPSESTTPLRCHLLELPRELRDEIWAYTILSDERDDTDQHGNPGKRVQRFRDYAGHILWSELSPPLLATCRQIRSEAGDVYYGKTRFLCDYPGAVCRRWLKSLDPETRNKIKFIGLFQYDTAMPTFNQSTFAPVSMGLPVPPWAPTKNAQEAEDDWVREFKEQRTQMRDGFLAMGIQSEAIRIVVGRGVDVYSPGPSTYTTEEFTGGRWEEAGKSSLTAPHWKALVKYPMQKIDIEDGTVRKALPKYSEMFDLGTEPVIEGPD